MSLMLLYNTLATAHVIGPLVSALCNGDSNLRFGGTTYAGVKIDNDGEEYEHTNSGGWTSSIGTWLDAGEVGEVWVECIVTLGSWSSWNGTGRWNCATDNVFQITQTGAGSNSVTCYFKFWDAASGGNLLQQTSSAVYTAINEVA